MSEFFEVKITGLREAMNYFSGLDAQFDNDIKKVMDDIARDIKAEASSLAPKDLGQLSRSIKTTPTYLVSNGFYSVNVGSDIKYAPMMEYGTGRNSDHPSGGLREHKVSAEALKGWVARKIGGTQKTVERIAFLIARSIKRKGGLMPRRFLRTALAQQAKTIDERFKLAIRKAISRRAGV